MSAAVCRSVGLRGILGQASRKLQAAIPLYLSPVGMRSFCAVSDKGSAPTPAATGGAGAGKDAVQHAGHANRADWVESVDPANGLPFWYNKVTMEHRDSEPVFAKYDELMDTPAPSDVKLARGTDGRMWESYRTQPPHDKPYWFHRPTGEATWKDPAVTPAEALDIDDGKPGKTWQSFKAFFGFGSPEEAAEEEKGAAKGQGDDTPVTTGELTEGEGAQGPDAKQGTKHFAGYIGDAYTLEAQGLECKVCLSLLGLAAGLPSVRNMAEVLALRDAVREVDVEFYNTLNAGISTIQAALHVYTPGELAFSFNGGKDSTVVLHLLRAAMALAEEERPLAAVRNVYFSTPDEFPEILHFIQACNTSYGMKMVTEAAFPDGLEDTVTKYGTRAILLGTRSTDPHGGSLEAFTPCSPGWPKVMRVNPILHWSYTDVWKLLWGAGVPVPGPYLRGYTSLGSVSDSEPNPALALPPTLPFEANAVPGSEPAQSLLPLETVLAALQVDDDAVRGVMALGPAPHDAVKVTQASGGTWYAPGLCLSDSSKERDGRVARKKRSGSTAAPPPLPTPASVLEGLLHSTCTTAGVVVIGDEVLKGDTADANGPTVLRFLADCGLRSVRCVAVADDCAAIAAEVASLSSACRVVVTTGGVGPTHDDVTMHGIAGALGVPLVRHGGMEAFLRAWHAARGEEATDAAMGMADLPAGAVLVTSTDVEAAVGGAGQGPGEGMEYPIVIVQNVVVLPGIPSLVAAKLPVLTRVLQVHTPDEVWQCRLQATEGVIAGTLSELEEGFKHQGVSLGSYPVDNGHFQPSCGAAEGSQDPVVRLVLSGPAAAVSAAKEQVLGALSAFLVQGSGGD